MTSSEDDTSSDKEWSESDQDNGRSNPWLKPLESTGELSPFEDILKKVEPQKVSLINHLF